ncbi:Uma2 family endonuclease [Tundrisphaera sp. TA3]|uniref:Uma2 family endonuclease n=1 Tax=Tundrisphaera sp. TA3 TaxID=3435775 RepID=UPI003EB9FEBF
MSTHTPSTSSEIEYPDSDGEPMAENTLQFRWIVTIQGGLDALFRDRPDVFVAGDLLWYPIEGDNKTRMAPDAMVVFGRPKGYRGSYMQWVEDGIAPQVVFEVLSPGNRPAEMSRKREFYERFGVEEYYVYDPDRVTLRGWLRDGETLRPIMRMEGWVSPRLGVRFGLREELEIYRPDGRPFIDFLETDRQRLEFEREARLERLRAEEADARAEEADSRAREADARAREADARAEEERARSARLLAKMREMGIDPESLD